MLLVGNESFVNAEAESYLWQGLFNDAIALFDDLKKKQTKNFQNYLRKHSSRIPDYQLYQKLGNCIDSGSVESWIKQIHQFAQLIGTVWFLNLV